jgi:hypothetical protein
MTNDRVAQLLAVVSIATLALVCGTFDVARAQCKPGDLLVGEDADNYYCRRRAEYEGSRPQALGARVCAARRTLAADQNAIRALGFAVDTERFEMFADVAREQKSELEHKVLDALFEQAFEATGKVVESAKPLNPWNVNQAADILQAKGFGSPTVIAALRRVARQKDKPAMAAAYQEFAAAVKGAKEGWSTGSAMAKDPDNAQLRLLLGALKVVQGNPDLGLAVTTAELGESLAYLAYVNGQVSELTKLTDDKLARLAVLSKRVQGHFGDVRDARKSWRESMGIRTGEPTCSS